jgi:hypothetical protein
MGGDHPMMPRRPFLLYLVVFFFLVGVLVTMLSLSQTIHSWNWLSAIGIFPSPVYLVFKNVFLLLAFAAAGITVWIRLAYAPVFSDAVVLVTVAWFWLDRVILTQNPLPFSRHILAIVLSVIIVLFFVFSMYLLDPFMKQPIGEKEDMDAMSSSEGKTNE